MQDFVHQQYLGAWDWNGLMAAHNEHGARAYVNMIYRAVGARDYAHGHQEPRRGVEYAGPTSIFSSFRCRLIVVVNKACRITVTSWPILAQSYHVVLYDTKLYCYHATLSFMI